MVRKGIQGYAIAFVAWLPFYALWTLFAMTYAHYELSAALATSMISMGCAGLLGIPVWHICQQFPWPLRLSLKFYLLQILLAVLYSVLWVASATPLDWLRRGSRSSLDLWRSPVLGWQLLMGLWLYGLLAGVSYAVQTRNRLHEEETVAARANALAAAARLDAIRARLNPHFLFNALHTLAALVKFQPAMAEGAIERLGDMLRYTLKEDGRELVEFLEEYDFTRQYIAFEQLRYEDRLKVDLKIDPESFHFDIPPFSIQTLAENAVRHAISVRPGGGSIWIACRCNDGSLTITVRDDGPGESANIGQSHQFGMRSVRERLRAAFGPASDLHIESSSEGFMATFVVPSASEVSEVNLPVGELR